MSTLLIALAAGVGFMVAYHTYGRWLARKIFRLDPDAAVPSVALRDDTDYVPTAKSIVFGHHFTSIAGTGPIVGPAIAITWGWVPALLWVVFGSIFIGALHDLGSLVISLRNRGQTIGDIAGRVLNPRVRLLFLCILLFGLWIVLAIFGWVIARVFTQFPESILPVWLQIPIAVWIGVKVHRKGRNLFWYSAIALMLMYLTVWFGAECPGLAWTGGHLGSVVRSINTTLAAWPIWAWTAVLLIYCYIASVIPVWVLLQPRDYINSLQLISSLALIVAGIGVAAVIGGAGGQELSIVAPAYRPQPAGAPPFVPFLFITIACGAISGFHCLVSSGTSSKQLRNERDAKFVGYGAMLTEGFLAVLVIIAVAAGLGLGWPAKFPGVGGADLWNAVHADWQSSTDNALGGFVVGASNFLSALGIERTMAKALIGVLVASFAGTTLDTATRLQRYVIQELATNLKQSTPALAPVVRPLGNPHGATFLAVASAFVLALFPKPGAPWGWDTIGQGGLILWPLFGATNQLLAGLAFLVICFWLWRRGMPIVFAVVPGLFMLAMPAWAMIVDMQRWYDKGQYLLMSVSIIVLLLEAWMLIEAFLLWPRVRGVLEPQLNPLTVPAPANAAPNAGVRP